MKVIKGRTYIYLLVLLSSCIERYYPESDEIFTGTLVINAALTNLQEPQTIQISRSDGLIHPEFIPETSCVLELENQAGEVLSFTEGSPGYYSVKMPGGFMRIGDQYMLRVLTSDGYVYLSDYSQLKPPTAIDKIYYETESYPTSDPRVIVDGIQFYLDFKIDADSSEFMRWELVETYEFHNPDYEGFIYSYDRVLRPIPDSMDDRQCWITGHVNEIYTLDAANISGQSYTHMPLHIVSNETQRLSHGYSLLVRQHSMDEPSFRYWDELKKNSKAQRGLYDRLPSLTLSNIFNVDDPEERVLGFFGVSGISEKRLLVQAMHRIFGQ